MSITTSRTRFARLGQLGILFAAVLLAVSPAWANQVLVSQSADRLGAITLDDAVLFGEVFVFFENTTPEDQIVSVEFYIDGKLETTDIMVPYDLVGGDVSAAEPFDTRGQLKALKDPAAPHTMQVIVNLIDGTSLGFDVQFFVDNTLAPLEPSSALQVVSATADAAARRLTLTGFNMDRNFDKGNEPQVSLDLQLLDIQYFDERTLVATLPGVPLRGDHLVNVSTDGNLVPGLQDRDHVEFLLTFGATDVSCVGCVSPQDVSFPYAQGDTQGGKALAASLADVAVTALSANFATTSATAGDTDLLDGLDSTDFALVGDTQALDSRVSANEGAITALESGVGVGVGGQLNPLQLALLRWYEANEAGNTFAVGDGPAGVAFDGANIWVANRDDDTVSKLRASDGMTLGTFAVGNDASGVAFDGANIWVTNNVGDSVSKL